MRLTILGGGGFRVPLVYGALLRPGSPITSVVLHDVDGARLNRIGRVLAAQASAAPGRAPEVTATTDLTTALTGADFVFSAIRVHGLTGRVIDERVALDLGVLGQETVGAGGISFGLRTVPVATAIARRIALVAPRAWVINFTNPAGLVTEAMAGELGDRVIGICDSPSALGRRVARAVGASPDDVRFDYAGLNHLGWLTGVREKERDLLPRLWEAPDSVLTSFEEGRLFGAPKLRSLGAVPNEYLHYYYDSERVLASALAARETRGEFLLRQQQECYELMGAPGQDPLDVWERTLRQRDATYMAAEGLGERDDAEGGGYEAVALALMTAIATDAATSLILNVRNRGTLPELDDDAVVEVPCQVDSSGVRPLPSALPGHGVDLVRRLKATERAVLSAAASGSRAVAVRAMASHPLIDSVPVARRLVAGYQEQFPELAYLR